MNQLIYLIFRRYFEKIGQLGKKAPFVYLHYLGTGCYIISDFTISDEEQTTAAHEVVEQALTELYGLMIQEKVVRQAANLKALKKIGPPNSRY